MMNLNKKTYSIFLWEILTLMCLSLLCTACSTYDSSQGFTSPALQSNSVLNNEIPANFEQEENLYAYIDSIMRDVIEHKDDPSIQITHIQKIDSPVASSPYSQEILSCIFLTFKDFPGNPPYSLDSRRLLQENPNAFLPQLLEQTLCNAIHSKNANIPFSIALSPHDFLPGERITWRLSGTGGAVFKEATFYPRPMILKDKSNKTILEAALLSIHNSICSYLIHFPAQDEVVEFISTSGEEIIKEIFPLNNSANMNYLPAVKGTEGGISQIEVRFLKNGSYYNMEFPWGTALLDSSTDKK